MPMAWSVRLCETLGQTDGYDFMRLDMPIMSTKRNLPRPYFVIFLNEPLSTQLFSLFNLETI